MEIITISEKTVAGPVWKPAICPHCNDPYISRKALRRHINHAHWKLRKKRGEQNGKQHSPKEMQ